VGPTAGQEKDYLAPSGIRTPDRPAYILVTILTELSMLLHKYYLIIHGAYIYIYIVYSQERNNLTAYYV